MKLDNGEKEEEIFHENQYTDLCYHSDSRAGGGRAPQDSKLPEETLTVAGLPLGAQGTCQAAYNP